MTPRLRASCLVLALVAAACDRPVPYLIAQESASHLTPGAAAALDACGITDFDPNRPRLATNYGIGVVAAMGLVTPGRDARKYAPLGPAPEVDTDASIWVVAMNSDWRAEWSGPGESRNETCIVPDGDWGHASWFITGDERINGVIVTPHPYLVTLALPPLGP